MPRYHDIIYIFFVTLKIIREREREREREKEMFYYSDTVMEFCFSIVLYSFIKYGNRKCECKAEKKIFYFIFGTYFQIIKLNIYIYVCVCVCDDEK